MKRLALILTAALMAPSLRADDFFTSKIEPVLKERCYECHWHEKKMEGDVVR